MKNEIFSFTKKRIIIFSVISLILCLICIIISPLERKFKGEKIVYNNLIVYYVDVDQGDSICIKLPDKKLMLIDAGNFDAKSSNKLFNFLEKNVFKNTDNPVIDYLILTHADSDHCGSMAKIFEKYEVKNFYRPMQYVPGVDNLDDLTYNQNNLVDIASNYSYVETIKASLKEQNLNTVYNFAGIRIENKEYGYSFEYLSPNNESYLAENDYSPMILLSYLSHTFLFTGDATTNIENEVISLYPDLKVEFLKVGHHGSNTSTSREFVSCIQPKYAIISCGKDNNYGFPRESVLTNLKLYIKEDNIFRTDTFGTVVISISTESEVGISFINNKIEFKIIYLFILSEIILFLTIFSFEINFKKKKITIKVDR